MKNFALVLSGLLIFPNFAAAEPASTVVAAGSVAAPPPSASAQVVGPLPQVAPEAEPQGRIGVELALLPVGSLKASVGSLTVSGETSVALGVGGVLQHPINQHVTVELAPRMVFHVKGRHDEDSATELDIRGRLTVGGYVTPQTRLYGAFEPGYSVLFLPDSSSDVTSPNGLTAGVAVGAAFKVAPKTMVTTEIGYQRGFQKTTITAMDVELSSNLLHLAVGVLFDL